MLDSTPTTESKGRKETKVCLILGIIDTCWMTLNSESASPVNGATAVCEREGLYFRVHCWKLHRFTCLLANMELCNQGYSMAADAPSTVSLYVKGNGKAVGLDCCWLSSCLRSVSEGVSFKSRNVIAEGFMTTDMQACTCGWCHNCFNSCVSLRMMSLWPFAKAPFFLSFTKVWKKVDVLPRVSPTWQADICRRKLCMFSFLCPYSYVHQYFSVWNESLSLIEPVWVLKDRQGCQEGTCLITVNGISENSSKRFFFYCQQPGSAY